jgi:AI-2 transport protein TqsA
VVALGVVLAFLVIGKSFLVPLAIAILIWHLLEALINDINCLKIGRFRLPRWFATILAIGLILLILYVITIWPRYVARMKSIVAGLADWFGQGPSAKIREEISKFDVTRPAADVFTSAQSFVVNVVLVFLYVAFLFSERRYINDKLGALFTDDKVAHDTEKMLSAISLGIRRYIWLKSLMSAITGLLSYAVLRVIGVDFAETWALLIFLLYYIPTVGPVLGVIFPALITWVQFDTIESVLGVAFGLTAIYAIVGNAVEPLLMRKSLNISAFGIVLSLTFWGTIWGVVGMFLSVPIMVVTMIVCANVPSWRWVSILLSKDGRINVASDSE